MRDGASLLQALLNHPSAFRDEVRLPVTGQSENVELHLEGGKILPKTVVEFAGNAAAFVILQRENASTQAPGRIFGALPRSDVCVDLHPSGRMVVFIEQHGPTARDGDLAAVSGRMQKLTFPEFFFFDLRERN